VAQIEPNQAKPFGTIQTEMFLPNLAQFEPKCLAQLDRKGWRNSNRYIQGSNSIKELLPAVLETDHNLQSRYSKSIGDLGLSSLNFDHNHIWITKEQGKVVNPYKMLPALFTNWISNDKEILISGIEEYLKWR
jgi:hypothetical protein